MTYLDILGLSQELYLYNHNGSKIKIYKGKRYNAVKKILIVLVVLIFVGCVNVNQKNETLLVEKIDILTETVEEESSKEPETMLEEEQEIDNIIVLDQKEEVISLDLGIDDIYLENVGELSLSNHFNGTTVGDCVYFMGYDEINDDVIYKMKKDGSELSVFFTEHELRANLGLGPHFYMHGVIAVDGNFYVIYSDYIDEKTGVYGYFINKIGSNEVIIQKYYNYNRYIDNEVHIHRYNYDKDIWEEAFINLENRKEQVVDHNSYGYESIISKNELYTIYYQRDGLYSDEVDTYTMQILDNESRWLINEAELTLVSDGHLVLFEWENENMYFLDETNERIYTYDILKKELTTMTSFANDIGFLKYDHEMGQLYLSQRKGYHHNDYQGYFDLDLNDYHYKIADCVEGGTFHNLTDEIFTYSIKTHEVEVLNSIELEKIYIDDVIECIANYKYFIIDNHVFIYYGDVYENTYSNYIHRFELGKEIDYDLINIPLYEQVE